VLLRGKGLTSFKACPLLSGGQKTRFTASPENFQSFNLRQVYLVIENFPCRALIVFNNLFSPSFSQAAIGSRKSTKGTFMKSYRNELWLHVATR